MTTADPASPTVARTTPPRRADFRHLERLRVRWVEIDAQQIVFNGHYLMYVDTAVAGWWRAMALPYHESVAATGGDMFVRRASLDYLAPARYDDLLDVGIRADRFGTTSLRLQTAVFRDDALLVHGELVYVHADPASRRPSSVPAALRDAMAAFEAGAPMVEVATGSWTALQPEAEPLRFRVFVDEQRVPADLELDAHDGASLHAVARNRLGLPLGTGRLLPTVDGIARIGRMAVRADLRGSGVGRQVLQTLIDAARRRGDAGHVELHAQLTALPFYRKAGFEPFGDVFDDAGIAHRAMRLALRPPG